MNKNGHNLITIFREDLTTDTIMISTNGTGRKIRDNLEN